MYHHTKLEDVFWSYFMHLQCYRKGLGLDLSADHLVLGTLVGYPYTLSSLPVFCTTLSSFLQNKASLLLFQWCSGGQGWKKTAKKTVIRYRLIVQSLLRCMLNPLPSLRHTGRYATRTLFHALKIPLWWAA